ncbi:MAG: hypothetical protein MUP85_17690 [Candidatus Lokiarchaeota archaeon]|nr:hypothetical protein [Candidatus Lokiarchaeota archaeon]
MIARIWNGYVLNEKSEDFFNYMLSTGVKDITIADGNQGVLILRYTNDILTKFTFISFWKTKELMTKFFKSDSDDAKLYPEDKKYLLTSGEKVKFAEAYLFDSNKAKIDSYDTFNLPPGIII